MKFGRILLAVIAMLTMASTARAGLIINSIDMFVAKTDYRVTSGSTFLEALNTFDSALRSDPICQVSLDVFDAVGGKQLCDGPRRDTGTAFFITGSNQGSTELQFGLDWGRGGFTALQLGAASPSIVKYVDDIWWSRNWNNSDVLTFNLNLDGAFAMLLGGFEGCCNGENSARWRTAGGEWQVLEVNAADQNSGLVSEPSALSLLVLGFAMAVFARRKTAGSREV